VAIARGIEHPKLMNNLKVPKFVTEAEEALWWESNEDALLDEFKKATAEGRVGYGTLAKRLAAEPVAKSQEALPQTEN
jgi:hypothetical protein